MRPDHRLALVAACSASFLVIGCGDSDSTPVASNNGASAAVDPGKPATPDQLSGAWFRVDSKESQADDVIGVEFASDGKLAILGRPVGSRTPSEITVNYAKLENGRVRLSADGGGGALSAVVQCNLNGDTLTIVPETNAAMLGFDGGQFTRLPAGKTIAARYAERIQERQAEAAALGEKLAEFLKQPNLAIVPPDGASGAGSLRVALNLADAGGGGYSGTALLTVANTTFERQAQLVAAPAATPPTVTVQLGPVTGPPGAKPLPQESFQFTATSQGGQIELRDQAGRALRVDADASKQLADAYAAGIKKQRELLDALHSKLGALVLGEGDPRPNQPTPRVALMRVPDKDQYQLASYRGTESSLTPASFTLPYLVLIHQDEAVLVSPQTNQILSITGEGDSRAFEGAIGGTPSRFKITQTLSLDDLKARQAANKAFVDSLRGSPAKLEGVFYQSYTYANGYVRPVRLDLSSADGKTLTGTYYSDPLSLALPISGEIAPTLLGLQAKFALARSDATRGERFDEGGTFTADVAIVDGKPTVVGKVQPGDGANRLELSLPDNAKAKALRAQLDAHLATGAPLKWARTGSTGGSYEVLSLELKPGAGETLSGTVNFRRSAAPVTGTVKTEAGQTVVDLTIAETPPNTVATGTMRLWLVPYGDTFYLSGTGRWQRDAKNRIVCYGPEAKP